MTDPERIIKGLEQFKADFKPFCGNGADWARVDDAIDLLKEQEAVEPKVTWTNSFGDPVHACGKCGILITESMNYCYECGRKVKWDG